MAVTDYWWSGEGARYGNYSNSHYFEGTLGYTFGEKFPLSLTWNTMFAGGDKDEDGNLQYSTYIEAKYCFDVSGIEVSPSIGISPWKGLYSDGFGWNSISLKAKKEIALTNKYSLPLFVQVIAAPEHDGKGGMVEEFSGKLLIQQEPDASSFPNGGIRNTFEARGYSAWDPSSPAFIVGDTLCIPTIFIAYTGESLDYKAPLLRALEAVNKAAVDVCHYFNPDVKKVIAYLGWEQEYFLVDEGLYAARPDLLLTGRTLMGHAA